MTSTSARRVASGLLTGVAIAYTLLGLLYYQFGVLLGLTATAIMLTVVALHYVNMRAGLGGRRPALFPLTLVLQALVTYVPDGLLPSGYSSVAAPMLAGSVLVLLPLRWGAPLVAAMTLYGTYATWTGLPFAIVSFFFSLAVPITGAMIYTLVRLARLAVELEEARAELAEAAVLKERLRISRDLHDGLGRSLTAIALKGDLAGRLLDRDPESARAEVTELVQVAREAAQDVRQVARGYRELSLMEETRRAVALLETSGVRCQTHLSEVRLPKPSDEALAWAVREAVTNIVRHSRATTCTITTSHRGGRLRLEIANDGVPDGPVVRRGGLTGLAERAGQAGGTLATGRGDADGFLLVMEVPA
ncbi:sensor histidine kinase [Nonomuraea sp. MCN248]|uniref:Sensor histidine kinase n=1 Tax=Nonomuraea corallina TaxID=2989783 RepID=A0ABT4SEY9_9ACTN|nr:sensor histidine kinase [Nonomuraea corallina]MDA0635501.1 sensor histidine kinase [Nonomuraea corallina]